MPAQNIKIANVFNRLADLLEIRGDNPFRIRAYRNAAGVVGGLYKDVDQLVAENYDFTLLPGIGEDLADKIKTIAATGTIPVLTRIEAKVPPVLLTLLNIEGLGPKRVLVLYKKLKIKTVADLKKAIEQGKLLKVKGFAEKTQQKILSGLENVSISSQKINLVEAFKIVDELTHHLSLLKSIKKITCAGSFRRRKEFVGDLDFVVTAKTNKPVIEHFITYGGVQTILSKGDTRSTIRLKSGLQVDLRVVNPKNYGAALLYFTGSKAHNIALRKIAIQKKWKLNEYGVFKGTKQIAGLTEKSIYDLLEMEYIEPEMREDHGEIELAKNDELPPLVKQNQISGDLRIDIKMSDVTPVIEEIIRKAIQLKYQYIALLIDTTHQKKITAQLSRIDSLQKKYPQITLLKSTHVPVNVDGTINLSDTILKKMDFNSFSIHEGFDLNETKQLKRLEKAMDNAYLNILSQPFNNQFVPVPWSINIEKLLQSVATKGCLMEVPALQSDLERIGQTARALGHPLVISSYARTTAQLEQICFGIYQARRAWLEKKDILNCLDINKLRQALIR